MRLLKLFGTIFSISLRRDLAFRANLIFQVLMTIIGIASGLAALGIIYTQTSMLGDWNLGESIALLGTFQIVSGVLSTFIEPNITWFANQVKDGKFDIILLQPVPSIFMVSLGICAPLGLSQVVLGFGVVTIGIHELGAIPPIWNILAWLLMLAVAIVMTWASRVLLASLAFWTPAFELGVLYSALWQFGRYPVSIYQQPMRFLLTYILPVAFIATIPTSALLQGISALLLSAGLATALAAIGVAQLVWNIGLRRYTSATS